MSIIAVIPARGGSKRIPQKNIKHFVGKPIIAYSIKSAKETNLFNRIIVSTDSEEISKVAKRFGAEVPFIRPAELADDYSTTNAVFLHALNWMKQNDKIYNYACCIYATAPLLQPEYLRKGYEKLIEARITSAFSVTTFPSPILRALRINKNKRIEMFWPEHHLIRSQDLTEAYYDAGQFYWVDVEKYMQERQIFSKKAVPVILPRYMVQDIDTIEDWEFAEKIYKVSQNV